MQLHKAQAHRTFKARFVPCTWAKIIITKGVPVHQVISLDFE
jgi:hypothetical protein